MTAREAAHARQAAAQGRLRALAAGVQETAARQELKATRFRRIGSPEAAPVAVSSWQLFPTPQPIARRMVAAADLRPGLRILEPSAGLGALVAAALEAGARPEDFAACELSPTVAGEFSRDFPGVALVVGDFLKTSIEALGGPFDRVLTNPPFHRGDDARHLLRAAEMLRPDGLLVGLCYDGAAFQNVIRTRCETWERLPDRSFREAGTDAGVVLVTMRHRPQEDWS